MFSMGYGLMYTCRLKMNHLEKSFQGEDFQNLTHSEFTCRQEVLDLLSKCVSLCVLHHRCIFPLSLNTAV